MNGRLLIFFGPVVDAFSAEEVSTTGALFGPFDNIEADGAVEHFPLHVGEEIGVVSILTHFVDFLTKNNNIYII